MISFNAILDALNLDAERPCSEIPPEWAQGRATFGGLVAALALRVMRARLPEGREPRSLLVSFIAPLPPGLAEVEVRELRSGRTTTQLEARVLHQGQVCCAVLGAFTVERESVVSTPTPAPAIAAPNKLQEFGYIAGMTPEFLRYFTFRLPKAHLPYSGNQGTQVQGWVRAHLGNSNEPLPPASAEWILALTDAWPPPILSSLPRGSAASSLTWAIDFLDIDPAAPVDGWWCYDAVTDGASHGCAHFRAELWNPSGRLVACSRQTVAFFPPRA